MIRKFASEIKKNLKRNLVHWQRKLGLIKSPDWQGGLEHEELGFWEHALADEGKNWDPQEYRLRMNPALELQPELKALIPTPPPSVIKILDVGSGPLTRIGRIWPDHKIEITATDPLAEHYNRVMEKLKIHPPAPVTFAHGEKLLEVFPRDHFDLAYSSNALDHSYDPLKAIEQMLAVVKPDHHVYLWHFSNVGKFECYQGLHQWNFAVRQDDFIISDGKKSQSLRSHFGGKIELACQQLHAFNNQVAVAIIKKIA